MKLNLKRKALVSVLATLLASTAFLAACGGSSDTEETAVTDTEDAALKFDAANYTTVNITIDGEAVKVRQYRIVYVASPIKAAAVTRFGTTSTLSDPYAMQTMIVSVPESVAANQKTALYFMVANSGWFASPVETTVTESRAFVSTSDTDHVGAALKAGYVVVNVGTRSRGARAEDGRWIGKAPAPVVDAKAAIRYLRLNDGTMPGSADRIIITGGSGGGGLTAAVAASGNSADYLPYLAEVGAAGISGSPATSTLKDDTFAAVAYCPINNLGNADAGYEWQYNAARNDSNTGALNGVAYSAGPQPAASLAIAAFFPAYLNGLGLKRADGSGLTDATMNAAIAAELKAEIERQIAQGTAVPALGENFSITQGANVVAFLNDWLTLNGTGTSATVADIDMPKFLAFVTKTRSLKTVVAFDPVGVTNNKNVTTGLWNISGETNLFGSDYFEYSNYTEWSWTNNAIVGDGSGANDNSGLTWANYLASSGNTLAKQLKLINPVAYLNTSTADAAPYWYVRHGMIDRDTAFAMQTTLQHAIQNDTSVKDLSFKFRYLVGHAGNYDVQEAFTWIKAKLDANP